MIDAMRCIADLTWRVIRLEDYLRIEEVDETSTTQEQGSKTPVSQ